MILNDKPVDLEWRQPRRRRYRESVLLARACDNLAENAYALELYPVEEAVAHRAILGIWGPLFVRI